MFSIKNFTLFILVFFSTQIFAGDYILWQDDDLNIGTKKSMILDRVLSYNKSRGYAGIIPVCEVNNEFFLLFSQEASDDAIDQPEGTFCEFGGGVDAGETMKKALLRECYEESCRVYDFRNDEAYLDANASYCYNSWLLTAFLKVEYRKRQVFMEVREAESKKENNRCYYEKDDFIWVNVRYLLKALNNLKLQPDTHPMIRVQVLNDDGSMSLRHIFLRGIFAKTLMTSIPILAHYVYQKNMVDFPPSYSAKL